MPTVEQILSVDNLMGLIKTVKSGIDAGVIPDSFRRSRTDIPGVTGVYRRVEGNRSTATVSGYGSPAKEVDQQGISEVPIKLLHSFEKVSFGGELLMHLQNEDAPGVQQRAMRTIARQEKEFSTRFENLRIAAICSLLSLGYIYFDANGNLLFSASEAAYTVDFGIPDSHRDQIAKGAASADLLTGDWISNIDADIPTQIRNLRQDSLNTTGYPLNFAFYGSDVPDAFYDNIKIDEAMMRNQEYQSAKMNGTLPQNFMDLTWIPLHTQYAFDESGTKQTLTPSDAIIFVPDPDSVDWWDVVEGGYVIPTETGVSQITASQLAGQMREVSGRFSYSAVTHNPVGIDLYAGDTVIPVIKNPNAIYIADIEA